MRFKKNNPVIFLAVAICFLIMFSVQTPAQDKSTRVLICNEKDSVTDTVYFPREAETFQGRKYAVWRNFIGDNTGISKGRYELTVSSDEDFEIAISRRARTPNSRWVQVNIGSLPTVKNSGGRRYYVYTFTVNKTLTTNSGGDDYFIAVLPRTETAIIKATWHTSNCEKGTGGGNTGGGSGNTGGGNTGGGNKNPCQWVEDTILGMTTGCTCKCNGQTAAPGRCGPKPRICP